MYSKLNDGQKNPSGCSFWLLWLMKLAQAMAKDLERKNDILTHLIMQIMENRRK